MSSMYFVRYKGETMAEMFKEHAAPYSSYKKAMDDARALIDSGEEEHMEIVHIVVEKIEPVSKR